MKEHITDRPLIFAASLGASVLLAFGAVGCGSDPCKDSVLVTAEEGTAEYEEQCENLKELQGELEEVEQQQDSQN